MRRSCGDPGGGLLRGPCMKGLMCAVVRGACLKALAGCSEDALVKGLVISSSSPEARSCYDDLARFCSRS